MATAQTYPRDEQERGLRLLHPVQGAHQHRERHDIAQLDRIHDEDHEQREGVALVREEGGRDDRRGVAVDVSHEERHRQDRRREVDPLVVLQEHDDPARDDGDEEEAEDIQAGRGRLLHGDGLEDRREGQQRQQRHEEEHGPRDIGGDEATADDTEEQRELEGGGAESEIALLEVTGEVLRHPDDIERLGGGQARGLHDAPGEDERPTALTREADDRSDADKDDREDEEFADAHRVRERRIDDRPDPDEDAGNRRLEARLVEGDPQGAGNGLGDVFEAVVDDEREDENRQQDGHGPLGDALGDGVRLRRHERARGQGGGGVTDSLLHGFLADPAWRRSSVDRSF